MAVFGSYNDLRQKRREFDLQMREMFDARNQVHLFISRILHQFQLSGIYEVQDVLVDVYVRGIDLISRGQTIDRPPSWIRATALNIVRELSRKERRWDTNEELLEQTPSKEPGFLSELTARDDWRAVEAALRKLDPEDQTILRLRFIDNCSWQEIADRSLAGTDSKYSAVALRQRGWRALKKLRKEYMKTIEFNSNDE